MSTSGDKKYLLDANVLISAHRSYYSFDICPGFWKSMVAGHEAGRIFSTARVRSELTKGNDLLTDWLKKDLPASFFLDDSTLFVASEFGPMMQWVQSRDYTQAAKGKFATDADGWIIATAKSGGFHVVTHEGHSDDAKKRVMMPTVCSNSAWTTATPSRCCGISNAAISKPRSSNTPARIIHNPGAVFQAVRWGRKTNH